MIKCSFTFALPQHCNTIPDYKNLQRFQMHENNATSTFYTATFLCHKNLQRNLLGHCYTHTDKTKSAPPYPLLTLLHNPQLAAWRCTFYNPNLPIFNNSPYSYAAFLKQQQVLLSWTDICIVTLATMGQEEGDLQGTFPVISTLTCKYTYITTTSKGRSSEKLLFFCLPLLPLALFDTALFKKMNILFE